MTRLHHLPWRPHQRVDTTGMAETEAASSIPPWPVDFGPRAPAANDDDTRPGAGAGCLIWPVVSAAAVVACVLLAHWVARYFTA